MPKNIIVCTDGTWNHPAASDVTSENFTSADTNVFKLFALLAGEADMRSSTSRVKTVQGQVTLYDDGVGADGIWAVRVSSSSCAMGISLSANSMSPETVSVSLDSAGAPLRPAVLGAC